MPSLVIPNSFKLDLGLAKFQFLTDTFKVMLSTSAYVPNVDTHSKRSNVSNEIAGTGYTAGGAVVVPTFVQDDTLNRAVLTFPAVSWLASTLSGVRVASYYKSRGGAASADELICHVVHDSDFASVGVTLTQGATVLTLT